MKIKNYSNKIKRRHAIKRAVLSFFKQSQSINFVNVLSKCDLFYWLNDDTLNYQFQNKTSFISWNHNQRCKASRRSRFIFIIINRYYKNLQCSNCCEWINDFNNIKFHCKEVIFFVNFVFHFTTSNNINCVYAIIFFLHFYHFHSLSNLIWINHYERFIYCIVFLSIFAIYKEIK